MGSANCARCSSQINRFNWYSCLDEVSFQTAGFFHFPVRVGFFYYFFITSLGITNKENGQTVLMFQMAETQRKMQCCPMPSKTK